MIVLDASAAADGVLLPDDRGTRIRERLSDDAEWLVPEHWRAEVFSVIRGQSLGGKISDDDAADAILWLCAIEVEQVGVSALLERMWTLRHDFSAYDAPYVVLAAERDLTLVTGDARLAKAAVGHCRVQLV